MNFSGRGGLICVGNVWNKIEKEFGMRFLLVVIFRVSWMSLPEKW